MVGNGSGLLSLNGLLLFGALESQTYGTTIDLYRNSSVTIGDTSADITNKLFVNGNTKIGGDLQLNGILKDSSGNARIFSNWDISGDDIYRDISGGNVGIGTTTPIGKLQVATDTGNLDVVFSAAANSDCRLVLQRNHGLNAGGSYNTIGDTYYIDWIIDNNSDNSSTGLKFTSKYRDYYAGSPYPLTTNDVMFLRYDGNVGIGTTSPQTQLDVSGTITSDSIVSKTNTLDNLNVGVGNPDYTFSVETKIIPSDNAADDSYGYSAAIDGIYAIVGARFDDDGGSGTGSAYIFDVTTKTELHKLTASDAGNDNYFGHSVAISGNYAIVGSPYDDDPTHSGSAYIFDVTTGTELRKLTASDAVASDQFGNSVAIDGHYAIVAAKYNDTSGTTDNRGAAYIFNVVTGTELHKITASDAEQSDYFGSSVAISGNYAIVSSPGNDDVGASSGSAYIFNITTGNEVHKLTASDAAASANFGVSVNIDGNYAIIGARGDNNKGCVYIFNVTSGTELRKITASDAMTNNYFGDSVAIDGNYAIVGAFGNGVGGSAYIFNIQNGTQIKKITASDTAATDYFGYSVAISSNYAIVTAYLNDDNGNNSGSAYIFGPSSAPPSLLKITDDSPNMVVNGNVGIGTTSPQTQLDVSGTITSDGLKAGTFLPSQILFENQNYC